jgi:hypothetical protein
MTRLDVLSSNSIKWTRETLKNYTFFYSFGSRRVVVMWYGAMVDLGLFKTTVSQFLILFRLLKFTNMGCQKLLLLKKTSYSIGF